MSVLTLPPSVGYDPSIDRAVIADEPNRRATYREAREAHVAMQESWKRGQVTDQRLALAHAAEQHALHRLHKCKQARENLWQNLAAWAPAAAEQADQLRRDRKHALDSMRGPQLRLRDATTDLRRAQSEHEGATKAVSEYADVHRRWASDRLIRGIDAAAERLRDADKALVRAQAEHDECAARVAACQREIDDIDARRDELRSRVTSADYDG